MAAEERLLEAGYRRNLIEEIKGDENNTRMEESLRDCDVYRGNMKPYVEQGLLDRFPAEVVREIPKVSSINILKKTADSKAGLYRSEPDRDFTDLNEQQIETANLIYRDMSSNAKFLESNRYYEVQKQNHIQIIPKNGRLYMRTLKSHQLNVLPEDTNPEVGAIYILSSYDKSQSALAVTTSDDLNQEIGDQDDFDQLSERYVVWSSSYHFVMDGHGVILSEEMENPIAPVIPIVEVSSDKDFEYWQTGSDTSSEFTVFFNESLSMLQQISEMQGFAQAYLKAPADLMPEYISVGPNRILKLVTNPDLDQGGNSVEFGYANPGSDLAGSQANLESLLSMFLSSNGIETSSVTGKGTGAQTFSSGIERLLSMIDKFEASRDVMDIYRHAENGIWNIVRAWLNIDSEMLDAKYRMKIPETSEVIVDYKKPESITTDAEALDLIERKIEMGLASRVDAIMEMEKIEKEDALIRIKEIDDQEVERTPVIEEQDIAEDQP